MNGDHRRYLADVSHNRAFDLAPKIILGAGILALACLGAFWVTRLF